MELTEIFLNLSDRFLSEVVSLLFDLASLVVSLLDGSSCNGFDVTADCSEVSFEFCLKFSSVVVDGCRFFSGISSDSLFSEVFWFLA